MTAMLATFKRKYGIVYILLYLVYFNYCVCHVVRETISSMGKVVRISLLSKDLSEFTDQLKMSIIVTQ